MHLARIELVLTELLDHSLQGKLLHAFLILTVLHYLLTGQTFMLRSQANVPLQLANHILLHVPSIQVHYLFDLLFFFLDHLDLLFFFRYDSFVMEHDQHLFVDLPHHAAHGRRGR